jgi:hypothetical protein
MADSPLLEVVDLVQRVYLNERLRPLLLLHGERSSGIPVTSARTRTLADYSKFLLDSDILRKFLRYLLIQSCPIGNSSEMRKEMVWNEEVLPIPKKRR